MIASFMKKKKRGMITKKENNTILPNANQTDIYTDQTIHFSKILLTMQMQDIRMKA